jgi:hypothetical protein
VADSGIAALIDVGAATGDPVVRAHIIRSLVGFGLNADEWRAIGPRVLGLLDVPIGTEGRSELIASLAGVPLASVRRRLDEIANDSADPDQSQAAALITSVPGGAESTIQELLAELEEDPLGGAVERLAIRPIEDHGVDPALFVPAIASADPALRLWGAVAVARLGWVDAVDSVLRELDEGIAPEFMGSPWSAYERLAVARPVPTALVQHLLDLERPKEEMHRDAGLFIWALTGTKDAEGGLILDGEAVAAPAAPEPFLDYADVDVTSIVRDLRSERCLVVLPTLTSEQLAPLVNLSPGVGGDLLQNVMQHVNGLDDPVQVSILGSSVVGLAEALGRDLELPVAQLVTSYVEAPMPVLEPAQFAFALTRAPRETVLESLARGLLSNAEASKKVLTILDEMADMAGRDFAPRVGVSPSPKAEDTNLEYIEDLEEPPPPKVQEKSLEMRVAELEDRLAQIHVTENDLKAGRSAGGGMDTGACAACVNECGGVVRPRPGIPRQPIVVQQCMMANPAPESTGSEGKLLVTRVPHIGVPFDGPAQPGTRFKVEVYADDIAPREGEESTPLELSIPPSISTVIVEVALLTTDQFRVVSSDRGVVSIERGSSRSTSAWFTIEVLPAADLDVLGRTVESLHRGALTAVFTYEGRASGKVTRAVSVAVSKEVPKGQAPPEVDRSSLEPPVLLVEHVERVADLRVRIVDDPQEPGRWYHCEVTTDLVQVSQEDAGYLPWKPKGLVSDLVQGYMERFTSPDPNKSAEQRLAALRGAGTQLFLAAPPNFQRTFWRIVDEKKPLKSISIVSDEPYMPWELMIPDDAGDEFHRPLGVEFAIGRWTPHTSVAAPQRMPMADSYAVAPTYVGRPLPLAADEAEMVVKDFNGALVDPATFAELNDKLHKRMAGLIHFACHGDIDSHGIQEIILKDDVPLATIEVEGADFARDIRGARPLIFLNACEVGRLGPALVGPGGFSSTFINLGAGGVVAALWSVKDTVAHEVAKTFYQAVQSTPQLPFAEILQAIRARAYEGEGPGEDSFAAYVFYGDPHASRSAAGDT